MIDSTCFCRGNEPPRGAAITLDQTVRVRFAPSPTGTLHIGSARTALYNFLFVRHHGGSFVLRVDDTDAARSDAALEASIMADLRWLGLAWDEGPDVGGPSGPYRQSERLERHIAAADELLASGQAYHCFCPEERLAELRLTGDAALGSRTGGLPNAGRLPMPRFPAKAKELGHSACSGNWDGRPQSPLSTFRYLPRHAGGCKTSA